MSKPITVKNSRGDTMTVTRLARDHWCIKLGQGDDQHDLGEEWGLLDGWTIQGAVMCISNARDYGYIGAELMRNGINAALELAQGPSEYREGVDEAGGLRDQAWIVRRFNGPRPAPVHPGQMRLI